MTRKEKPKCEVCFFQTPSNLKSTQLITCRGCKRAAHRYCYLPGLKEKTFLCDACTHKANSPVCCICHNLGLLKRTQEGDYGHPVCLMLCREGVVKTYKQLCFHMLRPKRKFKSGKCDICRKTTMLTDLFTCFERDCSRSAHFYCILKQQWKDTQDQNKWVQQLKIFHNSNFNFLQFFYNKVKKYVKMLSLSAYKAIFGDAKVVEELPLYIIYCRDHCDSLNNCFCVALEDANTKIDWVFCDFCGKWYHFNCEQIIQGTLQESYTCRCCREWERKFEANEEPVLTNFPRLHFYDLVHIQLFAESKSYHLSNGMKDLIKSVPFTCSLKNFSQNFKTREMISRVLKSTNFMCLKKMILDRAGKKPEIQRNLEKLDKDLINVLWKLDFVVSTDPLRAITGIKANKYKPEDVLGILQRYERKHNEGSNIIKPAIKELMKLKVSGEEEDQEEQNDSIQQEIQQISEMLRRLLKQIRKSSDSSKNCYQLLTNFYQQLSQHEFLKQLLKDYINQKRPFYRMFTPVFTYETSSEMAQQTRISLLFGSFIDSLQQVGNKKSQRIIGRHILSLSSSAFPKLHIENLGLIREIKSYNFDEEKSDYYVGRRNLILATNTSLSFGTILEANSRKQSYSLQQTQSYFQRLMQSKYLDKFFATLQFKPSSLAQIYRHYPKIRSLIKQLSKEHILSSFLKFYESLKKLIEGLYEQRFLQEQRVDVDLLQIIQNTKIDRSNIYRYCSFFTETCMLTSSGLNPLIGRMIEAKGEQFLNAISARSMVFQSQIEFKAASALMRNYQYSSMGKIRDLIQKNKELQDILSGVTIESLGNIEFMDSNMAKIKEARQFCQENGLQFRINKIEYMMKLYQCKEESFRHFPIQLLLKQKEAPPKRYLNQTSPQSVDFYLLKKYIYKMKLLKYPTTDDLFIRLNSAYEEKEDYMNTLSLIIDNYNALLANLQITRQQPAFTKHQILALIKSKQNQLVTLGPEEDEIKMICDLYEEVLQTMQRKMDLKCADIAELTELTKKLSQFPFQPQQNGVFFDFCAYLKAIKSKNQKASDWEGEMRASRKNDFDETSARVSQCYKSVQSMENLQKQIISKPRTWTLKQIETKRKELKSVQPECLKQLGNRCDRLIKQNNPLIAKFVLNQQFSQSDLVSLKKMAAEYETQFIRVEIIENIVAQLKIYEKAFTFPDCEDRSKLVRQLSQSFHLAFQSKDCQGSNRGEAESKSTSKSKRKKGVLKK